jgi:hypothetical protein
MIMKTTLPLSAAALLALAVPFAAQAGDFHYWAQNGAVTITRYVGSGGAVEIPSEIDGLPVRSIFSAFCYNSTVTSVIIPNTVTNIGEQSFISCTNLQSVVLPDGITTIEHATFAQCTNLSSIALPDSVTTIRDAAFGGCNVLTNLDIPKAATYIGNGTFGGCGLREIDLSNVTFIGDGAFAWCQSLTNVRLSNTVTNLGVGAFSGCSSLKEVVIPDTVTVIAEGLFAGCTSLVNVRLSSSVTDLGSYAFSRCSSLKEVVIPANATVITEGLFVDCTNLTRVVIPDGVVAILNGMHGRKAMEFRWGQAAFEGCTSLKGVYFYGNAPTFTQGGEIPILGVPDAPGVFDGSTNVTVYYLPGTLGWGATFADRPTAPWVLPYPIILKNSPSFGLQTNGFGFTISWATNVPVVVEASASLLNRTWTPLATNTLVNGVSQFSDKDWKNHPARFYRVRSN